MKEKLIKLVTLFSLLFATGFAEESMEEGKHHINFNEVPVVEFIRFVSKISEENFIFDHRELQFTVTMSSGKPISSKEVVKSLIQMLRVHGFDVSEEGNAYVVHRYTKAELKNGARSKKPDIPLDQLLAGQLPPLDDSSDLEFDTYKLKYHQGEEIEGTLKKIAADLSHRRNKPTKLIETIQTIQNVKATNSLFFSGDRETIISLTKLIDTLDVPRKQVFIEVLVVETDAKKTTEFGLEWVGGGRFKDKIGFGVGNFAPRRSALAKTTKELTDNGVKSGLSLLPFTGGFDLGVIGDIILHKGKTHLTLGSLVSALELDGDTNIILNQKIITQDNKNSTIFVGDNIPFTGSVVQTVGQSQQTTANIEYRDVGVNLSITPMLGDDDVISLEIQQEITEAIDDPQNSNSEVDGIRTTKTQMSTHAHVPDNHFLAISGMARNAQAYRMAGIPCLGGMPLIGAAFSKTKRIKEKRNIMIFVRPHIINTFEDYSRITSAQEGYTKASIPQREEEFVN